MYLSAIRRRRTGGSSSLSAQIQAMLAGTTGIAIDPTDLTTMWQDTGTATPVALNNDPVGHIRTKWGNTVYDPIQATAGNRPLWTSPRFLTPDGTDFLSLDGAFNIIRNAPFCYIAHRHSTPDNTNSYFVLSTATAGVARVQFTLNASGAISVIRRRLDADSTSTNTTTDTTVATGSTFAIAQDFAVDGVCAIYRNNVFIENLPAIAGTPGNTENTASARLVLLANTGLAFPATGLFGRMVILPFAPSAGQRAIIDAWLMEV